MSKPSLWIYDSSYDTEEMSRAISAAEDFFDARGLDYEQLFNLARSEDADDAERQGAWDIINDAETAAFTAARGCLERTEESAVLDMG